MNETCLMFFAFAAVLAFTDLMDKVIPNFIVIPGILVGCWMTGNWLWALAMLVPGLLLVGPLAWKTSNLEYAAWHGGDIKLFMLAGAFVGWKALPVLAVTIIFIRLYRRVRSCRAPLPVGPFMFAASLLTLAIIPAP